MQALLSQWWIWNIVIPVGLLAAVMVVGLRNGGIRRVDPQSRVTKALPPAAHTGATRPSEARRALQDVAEAQSTVSAAVARPTTGFWAASAAFLGIFTALQALPASWAACLYLAIAVILPIAMLRLRQRTADTGIRPRHLKGSKGVLIPLAFGGGIALLWLVGYLTVTATDSRLWWFPDGILVAACYLTAGIIVTKHQLFAKMPTDPGAPHPPAHP